jgi:tetratricopeptide (TPR) repeat protein
MAGRTILWGALAAAALWASAAAADSPTAPELPEVAPERAMLAVAGGGVEVRIKTSADADEDAVLSAVADVGKSGILAVKDHEAALRQVLADMPQPFERRQTVDGVLIYRGDSMADCIGFATTLTRPDDRHEFDCKGNPFASAGFYLGSYYNEIGQPDQALPVLELGLIAGPNATALLVERNAAFNAENRFADTLAGADRGLAIPNLSAMDRARFLRNRGYALTGLKRLDEAEQAYNDSLKYDPANPLAPNELKYIAQLRAGGPSTPGVIVKSGEAPK